MVLRWDVGDPEVDAFVDASLVSFAAWDLVIYLNRNPATCESAPSLAAILARHEHDLAAGRTPVRGERAPGRGRQPGRRAAVLSAER